MFAPTFEKAKKLAKDNADYFGRPYVVFVDTSGNHRVESVRSFGGNIPQNSFVFSSGLVINPDQLKKSSEEGPEHDVKNE